MSGEKLKEADLAKIVLDWLEAEGWDCYPEVQPRFGDARADIVAVAGRVVWIIEVKASFGLGVLEQAAKWAAYGAAHYVSVATPNPKGRGGFSKPAAAQYGVTQEIMERYRIGQLLIDTKYPERLKQMRDIEERGGRRFGSRPTMPEPPITERIPARMNPVARYEHSKGNKLRGGPKAMRETLHQDMKKYSAGGTAADGYSTPFKRTIDRAREYVQKNPGCTAKELADNVAHHYRSYSTARSSLLHWLQTPKFGAGVKAVREGSSLCFYPEEDAA